VLYEPSVIRDKKTSVILHVRYKTPNRSIDVRLLLTVRSKPGFNLTYVTIPPTYIYNPTRFCFTWPIFNLIYVSRMSTLPTITFLILTEVIYILDVYFRYRVKYDFYTLTYTIFFFLLDSCRGMYICMSSNCQTNGSWQMQTPVIYLNFVLTL
jgi:hypothetical protein